MQKSFNSVNINMAVRGMKFGRLFALDQTLVRVLSKEEGHNTMNKDQAAFFLACAVSILEPLINEISTMDNTKIKSEIERLKLQKLMPLDRSVEFTNANEPPPLIVLPNANPEGKIIKPGE